MLNLPYLDTHRNDRRYRQVSSIRRSGKRRVISLSAQMGEMHSTKMLPCSVLSVKSVTGYHMISGSRGSVSGRALDFGLIGVSTCGFEFRSLTFPPVLRDWVIKGFGMSSLVYATGHIKDPVPLIEKRRGLSPGGRFPPSFIHHHHQTE